MAKTKKKPVKRVRAKQQYLEGMDPPSIAEIDNAADAYRSARDERMELTEEEVAKATALLEAMQKNDLKTYAYDGYVVNVLSSSKVKVKTKKEPKVEISE